jgi:hypothetical protein
VLLAKFNPDKSYIQEVIYANISGANWCPSWKLSGFWRCFGPKDAPLTVAEDFLVGPDAVGIAVGQAAGGFANQVVLRTGQRDFDILRPHRGHRSAALPSNRRGFADEKTGFHQPGADGQCGTVGQQNRVGFHDGLELAEKVDRPQFAVALGGKGIEEYEIVGGRKEFGDGETRIAPVEIARGMRDEA